MLSLTSGKKITNEKVFKYQSAGDKTIEIVESAKLPQLAHHLRPIFGLVNINTHLPQIHAPAEAVGRPAAARVDLPHLSSKPLQY